MILEARDERGNEKGSERRAIDVKALQLSVVIRERGDITV